MSEVCSRCKRGITSPFDSYGPLWQTLCRDCFFEEKTAVRRLMRASEGMEAEGWNLEVTADWTPEEIEAEARNGGDDE